MFEVILDKVAYKQLEKIPKKDYARIVARIQELAKNPKPADMKKLTSSDELYRIRQGNYRIIYTIREKRLLVLVLRIGHRKDIYRDTL